VCKLLLAAMFQACEYPQPVRGGGSMFQACEYPEVVHMACEYPQPAIHAGGRLRALAPLARFALSLSQSKVVGALRLFAVKQPCVFARAAEAEAANQEWYMCKMLRQPTLTHMGTYIPPSHGRWIVVCSSAIMLQWQRPIEIEIQTALLRFVTHCARRVIYCAFCPVAVLVFNNNNKLPLSLYHGKRGNMQHATATATST
jgi:hypothetical protein